MDAGQADSDFARTSMIRAIAAYVVAFVKREGLSSDQTAELLEICQMQRCGLLHQDFSSLDLDTMINTLSSIGEHISVHKSPRKKRRAAAFRE